MKVHSSKLFSYNKASKTFFVEASMLARAGEPLFVKDFSNRDRLVVESTKTGQRAIFDLQRTVRDAENDVECWELVPSQDTCFLNPDLIGTVLRIYND